MAKAILLAAAIFGKARFTWPNAGLRLAKRQMEEAIRRVENTHKNDLNIKILLFAPRPGLCHIVHRKWERYPTKKPAREG
jgi:hypothetical protein